MPNEIHVVSLGAGRQSSTMVLRAAHGEITPMPIAAIFADTQDEPQAVYEWLAWLEKQLPFPVIRCSKGSLSKRALTPYWSKKNLKETVVGMPMHYKGGIFMRQCTSEFKVQPIDKEITKLMRQHRAKKCVKWIGISLDEAHRMKPSRRTVVEHRWPLIEDRMTIGGCIEWMKRNEYPEPPKSACRYCPYQSDRQFRKMRDTQPLEFQKAIDFEVQMQSVYARIGLPEPFVHRSCISLDQVDFSTDEDHGQQVMFGNECEGMCGV